MIKPGAATSRVIKFNRIEAGLYRSNAYDGFGRMKHAYEVSFNNQGGGWNLLVDGEWYGGYGKKNDACAAATKIERKET